jgi:predicted nucleic acid-binding protein
MIILDTNLWIYGLVRNEPSAVDLIERTAERHSRTAFDAYSVLEFTDRMEKLKRRGVREDVIDEARNDFYSVMTGSSNVESYPTRHELRSTSLADVRHDP